MTQDELDDYFDDHTAEELRAIQKIAWTVREDKFPKGAVWSHRDQLEIWHCSILVWEHRQLWAIQ